MTPLGPPFPQDHEPILDDAGVPPWTGQPSMYQPKNRISDNADLVLEHQLLSIAIIGLMKLANIYEFNMGSIDVATCRMERPRVEDTETGGIQVRRES